MIKRFLIAFVLLAVVCGGLVYFNIFRNQAIENFFATMQQPALPVQTVTAEPASWQPGIEAIGTVSAVRGVDLAVEAGGVVREVNFTSNDAIEEGTVLVQIDDQIEQSNLIAATLPWPNRRLPVPSSCARAASAPNRAWKKRKQIPKPHSRKSPP
jgi:membrane fusion protein, multidrug efflux system